MKNEPTRADIARLQDGLIETQEVWRQRYRFPPLKSQEEIDAEAGLSGVVYMIIITLGAAAAMSAIGIGYMVQSWWMSW